LDNGFEMYCLTDPVFFDSFARRSAEEDDFELARAPGPDGWQRTHSGDWVVYLPAGVALPAQGWKIHASATTEVAADVVATVHAYCIARTIAFKFIRSPELYLLRNVKYAARSSSGKLVTIYPRDDEQLEAVLTELGAQLDGQPGPYILSDLRWGAGPLHVRYGGFAERHCVGAGGALELALEDPTGRLVPDRRGPTFATPPWVTLPACLAPHLDARNSTTVEGLPYRITRALHFSNGGGVYAGTHLATGDEVVLKEARPHAGLVWDGTDAIARLGHERDMLARLDGLDVVPALRDYFMLGDHHFLVEDFVDGPTLGSQIVRRFPFGHVVDPDEEALATYASWALDVSARVEAALELLHARDVVVGDLSPANMLVRADGSIVLVDLEVATLGSQHTRPSLGASAFLAPVSQTGFATDRYALACLRLYMFLPQHTALCLLDAGKAHELASAIGEAFPTVPTEFLSAAARVITRAHGPDAAGASGARPPRIEPEPAAWHAVRDSMAAAICASATPDRGDRLFPGGPEQFAGAGGGLGIAYGAAGVLLALHATGADYDPSYEDWLVRRATSPPPGTPVGLYDGLLGVAHVLDRLGRHDDALKVLELSLDALRQGGDGLGLGLRDGLSGIALALAEFAERLDDARLWDAVWRIADMVTERLGGEDSVARVSGGAHPFAGLLNGSSGPALMFLRLYEQRDDDGLLDLAATAIRQDLRRCVLRGDTLEVDEGYRTLPYLADGSVGIGFAIDDYLDHREDERFAEAVPRIRAAASSGFYALPGLLSGRAGMILYLSRRLEPGQGADDPLVAAHVRRLNWHAVSYAGDLAFPGEQLVRLSMDLGTGTAGVLLALGAALHDQPVHLPCLGGARAPAARPVRVNPLIIGGR
jgi:tRNA A-37 threonylcarbamoyl transferase component Bud32